MFIIYFRIQLNSAVALKGKKILPWFKVTVKKNQGFFSFRFSFQFVFIYSASIVLHKEITIMIMIKGIKQNPSEDPLCW